MGILTAMLSKFSLEITKRMTGQVTQTFVDRAISYLREAIVR